MDILPIVKLAAGAVSGLSTGYVVGNALKAVTPDNLKLAGKIGTAVGGFLISAIAADLASDYVDNQIDTFAESVKVGKKIGEQMGFRARAAAEDLADHARAAAADVEEIVVEEKDQVKD